jgi:hypothetical protein
MGWVAASCHETEKKARQSLRVLVSAGYKEDRFCITEDKEIGEKDAPWVIWFD